VCVCVCVCVCVMVITAPPRKGFSIAIFVSVCLSVYLSARVSQRELIRR